MVIIGEGLRREDWAEGGGQCPTLNGQGRRGLGPCSLLALASGTVSGRQIRANRRGCQRRGGSRRFGAGR